MRDLINRQAAMESLTREYNRKGRSGGLQLAWIEKAINEVPTAEPRWIPASEKLPTDRDWCLGVFKEKSTGWVCIPFVCEYLGIETSATTHEGWTILHCTDEPNKFGGDYFKELTCVAWMPLPEPYEERREADGSD